VYVADVAYLKSLSVIEAFVVAEMYRLGGEKKFQEAFDRGLATLRVLRQVADQHLLEEKLFAMEAMCDMASVQRDVLQTFLADVPAPVAKKFALAGFAFIRPTDGERLRRLEMPEGDRVLAEALIAQLFDAQGQPDTAKFAATMGSLQARKEPLSAFGAARRWTEIADVHGSLDATRIHPEFYALALQICREADAGTNGAVAALPDRQEAHVAVRVGVELVRPQGIELASVHLLDMGLAGAVGDVDGPHPVAGFPGGLRLRTAFGGRLGELLEEESETGLFR
jgi:hypothetical protein